MGKVQPLHPTDAAPFPSAERATLAALIEQGNIATRTEGELREAVNKATVFITQATGNLGNAARAVEAAKQAQVDRATEAAMARATNATPGSRPAADTAVHDALDRENQAHLDLSAAQTARTTLVANLERAQQVARKADTKITEAARAVLAAEVQRLLAEAKAAQQAASRCRLALQTVMDEADKEPWKRPTYCPAIEEAVRFLRTDPTYGEQDFSAVAHWKAAIASLLTDADAQLLEA